MSINSRKKGNKFETDFCVKLRELGYDAVTSRSESKRMDDKGVDVIDNSKFYFQLKAVERMHDSYHDILKRMPTEKIRVIAHKRNNKGTVIVMRLEDFEELHLKQRESQFYENMYP